MLKITHSSPASLLPPSQILLSSPPTPNHSGHHLISLFPRAFLWPKYFLISLIFPSPEEFLGVLRKWFSLPTIPLFNNFNVLAYMSLWWKDLRRSSTVHDGETWEGGSEKCSLSVYVFTSPMSNRKAQPPHLPPMGSGIWLSLDLKLSHFLHLNNS